MRGRGRDDDDGVDDDGGGGGEKSVDLNGLLSCWPFTKRL